jgi:hypothetical protein
MSSREKYKLFVGSKECLLREADKFIAIYDPIV